jgi:hypothetical protein
LVSIIAFPFGSIPCLVRNPNAVPAEEILLLVVVALLHGLLLVDLLCAICGESQIRCLLLLLLPVFLYFLRLFSVLLRVLLLLFSFHGSEQNVSSDIERATEIMPFMPFRCVFATALLFESLV